MGPCPDCSCEFPAIPGDGPQPCSILFLGERPGKIENLRHAVFCGPTGEELNDTYLPRAGLHRSDVRIENCVRCWAQGNRTPSRKEVLACAGHFLPRVIERTKPDVLVLMGGSACHILDEPKRLDMYHGRPVTGSILGGLWEGPIWLSYHPALGLHATTNMTALLEDFTRLGEWLREEWEPPHNPRRYRSPDYRMVSTAAEFEAYAGAPWGYPLYGIDTESHGRSRWSTQISHTPGTGRIWRANNHEVNREFAGFVRHTQQANSATWIFHHAPHDLDELERDGITFERWRDTMQEAYHFGSLPQGLKPLVFRLLGVEMRSWEDVVLPASQQALRLWMEGASELSATNLSMVERKEGKRGWCRECGHGAHRKSPCSKCPADRPCPANDNVRLFKTEIVSGAFERIFQHVLRHMESPEYDPWEALTRMRFEGLRGKTPEMWEWDFLVDELGPCPILGIDNCELSEAVAYGCSDADHTLQAGMELDKRRATRPFEIQEGDEDQ